MSDGPHRPHPGGGDDSRAITAARVASVTGGRVLGDADRAIGGVAPLDRATEFDLSFFAHQRYAAWYAASRAGVVLVDPQFERVPTTALTRIIVERPSDAMTRVLHLFKHAVPRPQGVHATATVAANAKVAPDAAIDAGAVIGADVVIGARTWVGANAVVRERVVIGEDVDIHPAATIYPDAELGDRVVVHAGARIGREGFGFLPRADGVERIPHIGRCVLEHDVEVGANSCIDRGSVDDTIIGAFTKIDNLVHIAHNTRVGRFCFIAAQTGVAGSTRIGDGVQMGGQVGVIGHITIGAKASLGAQAGVIGDVPAGETWSGYPARPHREQLRSSAALGRLAKLIKPLERLIAATDRESSRDSSRETNSRARDEAAE